MALSRKGTYDFCQSYKQPLFCQPGVILLKAAGTKFILLGLTKYTQSTQRTKKPLPLTKWQDDENMMKAIANRGWVQ